MRYGQRVLDPGGRHPQANAPLLAWTVVAGDDPSPVIEELGTTALGPVSRPVDRRLGLIVGIAAAIVGFGFMTRDWYPPTPRGGDDDIAPVGAETSAGPALPVLSDDPTATPGPGGPAVATDIVVGVALDAGGLTWLTIDGSAMTTVGAFDVVVRGAAGELLANGSVAVMGDDERPASTGGQRVGSGSIHGRIRLPVQASLTALRVTIHWGDPHDGSTQTVSEWLGQRVRLP
jgi:hypothetical protein